MVDFDDMIADIFNNKNHPIVNELFIRGRKLNISVVFITQSYLAMPKNIRLNSTHYFFMKTLSKQELQKIASNSSSDTDFKGFINLYKKYAVKLYSFLVIDATLPSDNPFKKNRFRKNLLERM